MKTILLSLGIIVFYLFLILIGIHPLIVMGIATIVGSISGFIKKSMIFRNGVAIGSFSFVLIMITYLITWDFWHPEH